jgi:hypothetical protein
MLRLSLVVVALFAWSGAAYAQKTGSWVAGVPGGIWIDQDADGRVDGYLLNGEIHLQDGRVVSSSPVAPPLAPGAVSLPANWAGLDRLVGKTFRNPTQAFVDMRTWRWLEPGKILAADVTIGASKWTERWVIDPNTGLVVGYFLDPDGTLATKPVTLDGKTTRFAMKVLSPDAYETRLQVKKKNGWATMAYGRNLYETEAALAARQQQSGGGDDTFGRALGGALMGAMLGGGGQNSVDLAVAGAQAAAQGGNPLQVLNSMGDVAAANAAESKRQLDETIARAQAQGEAQAEARRLQGSRTATNTTSGSGISQDTHGPLPEGDSGEGSVKVVTRESVSQSRTPTPNPSCPFEPVTQASGCDGFDRVPVYGHFKGISTVSLEAAKAQAFAECAKAGKSCVLSDTYVGDSGGYFSAEVAYKTGEYRRVSKGASSVSSE